MNARLSSLLVAGGVVLAGIQSGSLKGAIPDAGSPTGVTTLQEATFLPTPVTGAILKLAIPGFSGVPRLQVLANPSRVVVDLPGVTRGGRISKKDVLGLTSPLILRSRLAQFATAPEAVTRLVLEVVPGTQVAVSSDPSGVVLALTAGSGAVKVEYGQTAQAFVPAPTAATPETEAIATSRLTPEVTGLAPRSSEGTAVAALQPQPLAVAAPAPAEVRPSPAPLARVPAVGAPFQSLPALAVSALLPVTPEAQDKGFTPLTRGREEGRREDARAGRTLGEVGNRYTGAHMTIDVASIDLVSFLRIIAETAKLNLIADSDIQGSFAFKFVDCPWDLVLDMVLKNAGLGKEISNGIIRVAKVEKLQKEEEDRKRLDDARALAGDVQSITRPLSFSKASEAKNVLDKVLTKRGGIIVDDRTNTLIISDLPRNLPLIDDLIAQLDVQIQQVQIEARVVEASKNFSKAFGVKWPTNNSGDVALTNAAGATTPWMANNAPSWNSINNRSTGGNQSGVGFAPGKDGATTISGPAGEFWVSFLSSRVSLNVILQALEKEGVVKIISSPKVVTQNNKKAKVLSGSKIPYPAAQAGNSGGAIAVQFADANLELEVTPQITNDGTILMDIHVEKADADFSRKVGDTPTITRKMVDTQVLVKDGGTAIMGGVYKNNSSTATTGVPFLAKLPLLGFLFRNKTNEESNDELLVFITPRILKN